MIAIRDIPKPIRDRLLVESLEPVQGPIENAVIERIAYTLSHSDRGLKLTLHKAILLQAEYDQLVNDVNKLSPSL